jgi:hypothetical protein
VALAVLASALAMPVRANAAESFSFIAADFGSGTISYGLLQATDNGDGTFTATGGSLVVLTGPDVGTYALFPNPNSPPAPFASPSGAFIADNVLYPGQDPSLDMYGLLFTGNGLEVNIWGNSPGSYSYWSFNGSTYNLASSDAIFILASTPGQQIEVLQVVVALLVDTGVNLPAQGNSLEVKLNAALAAVVRGNAQAAIGSLQAFINQVNAFIKTGQLTAAQGQSLIDQATAIINALE